MSLQNQLFKSVIEIQFKDKFGEKDGVAKLNEVLNDDSLDEQGKIGKIREVLEAGKVVRSKKLPVKDDEVGVVRKDGSVVAVKKDAKNFDGRLFRMGGGRKSRGSRGKAMKRRTRGHGKKGKRGARGRARTHKKK